MPPFGPIAQLGERRVRNAEVEGSIPFRSTTYYQALLNTQERFYFLLSPRFRLLGRLLRILARGCSTPFVGVLGTFSTLWCSPFSVSAKGGLCESERFVAGRLCCSRHTPCRLL